MITSKAADSDGAPPAAFVLSNRRIFPTSHPPPNGSTTTTLSIVDATVTRFAVSAAVWLYDANDASKNTDAFFDRLETSLAQTLNDYRHFAGQLRWASSRDDAGASNPGTPALRLGRPEVTYGTANDPGVELVCASYNRTLADVVPSREMRGASAGGGGGGGGIADRNQSKNENGNKNHRVWIATEFPQDELLPSCHLAFAPSMARPPEGLPGVSVQLTGFRCGGFAVGVRMTHCLGDAMCLVGFVRAWAAAAARGGAAGRGGSNDEVVPRPVFDPGLLDRHAGDTHEPDGDKVALARSLPMHRYDWWDTRAPGYPAWATADSEATRPPDGETGDRGGGVEMIALTPSTRPPWPTWDLAAPVEHVQIRFGAGQVRRMREAAQAALLLDSSSSGGTGATVPPPPGGTAEGARPRISRLDALLAHVWILVNRARAEVQRQQQQQLGSPESGTLDDGRVYMNVTLGLRGRVSPPLPDGFAGSPILLGHASLPASSSSSSSDPARLSSSCDTTTTTTTTTTTAAGVGAVAATIRAMTARFTPEAVGAYLHDAAREVSPQRLWQAFLGSRHLLVTAWTRLGVYGVDFVGGGGGGGGGPRYVQGRMPRMDGLLQVMDVGEGGDLEVSLCLEKGAMGRLLADESLWAWEGEEGS